MTQALLPLPGVAILAVERCDSNESSVAEIEVCPGRPGCLGPKLAKTEMGKAGENDVQHPKSRAEKIQEGLERTISTEAKQRIEDVLNEVNQLSDVEKLLLYLKLPTGAAVTSNKDVSATQAGTSNRFEQIQAVTWIKSHLEEDPGTSLPKQEVFEDYRMYCETHANKALSQADFGKMMKCVFPNVKPRRLGQRGQSKHCYGGLRKKLNVKPPNLPELSLVEKAEEKEEGTPCDDVLAASCELVCEWSQKLLNHKFPGVKDLAEYLIDNMYVNSRSMSAFTVLASVQKAVQPRITALAPGPASASPVNGNLSKHRETQLQLQRKLQEREHIKEQKRKLEQQRSEMKYHSGDGSDSRSADDSSGDSERTELCQHSQTSNSTAGVCSQQRPSDGSYSKPKVVTPQKLILPKDTLNQSPAATASSQGKPTMAAATAGVGGGGGSGSDRVGTGSVMVTSTTATGQGPQQILVFSPTSHPTQQGQQPVLLLSPIHRGAAPLQHSTSQQVMPVQSVIMNAIANEPQCQVPATVTSKSVSMVQVPVMPTQGSSHSGAAVPKGFTLAQQLATQTQPGTVGMSTEIADSSAPKTATSGSMPATNTPSNIGVVESSAFMPVGVVTEGTQKHTDSSLECQATVTWSHPSENSASVQSNCMLTVGSVTKSVAPPVIDCSRSRGMSMNQANSDGVNGSPLTPTLATGPAVSIPLTPTSSSVSAIFLNSPTSLKLLTPGSSAATVSATSTTCTISGLINDSWSTATGGSKLASKTVSSLLKEQRGYGPSLDNKAPYVNDRRPVSALLKDIRAKRQLGTPTTGVGEASATQSLTNAVNSSVSTLSPNTVMIQTLTISKPRVSSTATVPAEHSPRITAPVPVVSTGLVINSSADKPESDSISNSSSTTTHFKNAQQLMIKAEAEAPSSVPTGASLEELLQQPIEEVASSKKRTLTTSDVLPRKRQNTGSNLAQKRNANKQPAFISHPNSQLSQALMALSPSQPKIDAEQLRQEIQRQIKAGLQSKQTGFASRLAISMTKGDAIQPQKQHEQEQQSSLQQQALAGPTVTESVVSSLSESREVNVSSLEKDALNDYFLNDPVPDLADITPSIAQMVHSQEVQTVTDQDTKSFPEARGSTGRPQVHQLIKAESGKQNTILNTPLKAFLSDTSLQPTITSVQIQPQQPHPLRQKHLDSQACKRAGSLDMFSDPLPQTITTIGQTLLKSAESTPHFSPAPLEQSHQYVRLKRDVLLSQAISNKTAVISAWQQQQQQQQRQQQHQRQRHRSFPDHTLRLNAAGRDTSVSQQGFIVSGMGNSGNRQGSFIMTTVGGNFVPLEPTPVTDDQPQMIRSASAQGMVMVSTAQQQQQQVVTSVAETSSSVTQQIAQHNLIFRLANEANLQASGLSMDVTMAGTAGQSHVSGSVKAGSAGQGNSSGAISHPPSPGQLLSPSSVSTQRSASSTPVSVLSPLTPMSHGMDHSRSVGPSPVEVNSHAFMPIHNLQLEGAGGVNLVRPTATVASTVPQTTLSTNIQQQLEVAKGSRFMPYSTQPDQNVLNMSLVNQQQLLQKLQHQQEQHQQQQQQINTNVTLCQKLVQKVSMCNNNKGCHDVTSASVGRRKDVAQFAPASSIKPVKRGGRGANKSGTGRRQRHHSAQSALGGATSTPAFSAVPKYSLVGANNKNSQVTQDLKQPVNVSIMTDVNVGLGSSTPESPFSPEIQDIFCGDFQNATRGSSNMFRSHSVPVTDLFFDSDISNSNDMFPQTSAILDQRQDSQFVEDLSGTYISSLASLLQGKLQDVPSNRGVHSAPSEGFSARRNLTELIEQSAQLANLTQNASQKHTQGNTYYRECKNNFDFDDQTSSDPLGFRGRGDVTLTSASLQDAVPRSMHTSLSGLNSMTTTASAQSTGLDFSSEIQNVVGQNPSGALSMQQLMPTSSLGNTSNLDTPSSMDTLSTQDSRDSLTDSLFQNTYDGSVDLGENQNIDIGSDFGFPQWDMSQVVHD